MKMRIYAAQSIGDILYQNLLGDPHRGQIHSVYPTAINFEINGNLYCIVKAKIGNGPHSMLMPPLTEDLNQLGFAAGDPVLVDQGVFQCKDVAIEYTAAGVWDSEWKVLPDPERLFRLSPQIRALVAREGNLRGLGWVLMTKEEREQDDRTMDYAQMVLLEQALPVIKAVRTSLTTNPAQFWNLLLPLVGLGSGKTPAGDDFLTGMFYMFRYLELNGKFVLPEVNITALSQEFRRRTNLMSATSLILALENKPFELLKDFIENICSGQKVQTILSALRLIDRGSSSGTDILTGILLGGEVYQEIYYIYQRNYI